MPSSDTGEPLTFELPERCSIGSVTMRKLEPLDIKYALAGIESANAHEAVEILRDQTQILERLRARFDFRRLSITAVDGVAITPPYLERETFLGWSLRTLEFIGIAFDQMHPDLSEIVGRALATSP